MAWTAPRTWTTAEVVTAAIMNTHVRDNFLETAAATATTAGDIVYADGNKSMGSRLGIGGANSVFMSDGSAPVWRAPAEASTFFGGSLTETDTSTGYTRVWGTDLLPAITATTGTRALVIASAMRVSNTTAGAFTQLVVEVTGATSIPASNETQCEYESSAANDSSSVASIRFLTLTAGSNTFTMQAKVTAGTGTIIRPRLFVLPF